MRPFDFAPLDRSTVGFDRLFSMLDQAVRVEPSTQWPPYDIEKVADDAVRITMLGGRARSVRPTGVP